MLRKTSVRPYIRKTRACGWATRNARTLSGLSRPPAHVITRNDGSGVEKSATRSSCIQSGGTHASTVVSFAASERTISGVSVVLTMSSVAPVAMAQLSWLKP